MGGFIMQQLHKIPCSHIALIESSTAWQGQCYCGDRAVSMPQGEVMSDVNCNTVFTTIVK